MRSYRLQGTRVTYRTRAPIWGVLSVRGNLGVTRPPEAERPSPKHFPGEVVFPLPQENLDGVAMVGRTTPCFLLSGLRTRTFLNLYTRPFVLAPEGITVKYCIFTSALWTNKSTDHIELEGTNVDVLKPIRK